jgi:hypothetical protein
MRKGWETTDPNLFLSFRKQFKSKPELAGKRNIRHESRKGLIAGQFPTSSDGGQPRALELSRNYLHHQSRSSSHT